MSVSLEQGHKPTDNVQYLLMFGKCEKTSHSLRVCGQAISLVVYDCETDAINSD